MLGSLGPSGESRKRGVAFGTPTRFSRAAEPFHRPCWWAEELMAAVAWARGSPARLCPTGELATLHFPPDDP